MASTSAALYWTKMRFAIDAHAIGRRLTGNETYVRNLLTEFASLAGNAEFVTYIAEPEAASVIPRSFTVRTVSRNPFRRLGWDLSAGVRADRPDLLHVQYTAPLFCRVPVVVSVHDVSFLEHPEFFAPARALQLRWTVARTVARAARVLCPSEFSRERVIRAYQLDPRRVEAIHNGVAASFRPLNRMGARNRLRGRLPFQGPFLLTVGDLRARKNHLTLLRAFEELLASHPHLPHHLVLAGKEPRERALVREAVERSPVRERIHLLGFVTDQELLDLYNAADLMVFPSLYEGFGLPVLEAMACGCPVACSNTSALPEVADGAGLLFDPQAVPEVVRAIRDVLLDPELAQRLRRLGQARAAHFQWRDNARRTLEVYREVAGGTSRMVERQPLALPER